MLFYVKTTTLTILQPIFARKRNLLCDICCQSCPVCFVVAQF